MTKPRIRAGPLTVTILIIVLLTPLCSTNGIAHAQSDSQHLDETGKIGGIFLRPGVRDEFKSDIDVAWSHTLDTLRGTQGGDAQRNQIISRYQDYAILASSSDSIGDFQFDFWIAEAVSDIRIYLPSNFTFAYTSSGYGDATSLDKVYSVWTDITNDYSYISVRTLDEEDLIAPGWDRVEIGRIPTPNLPVPSFQVLPGLYHIRLFQIRAPFTAGLYHFKIYVDGESIGEGNFPITIVKSTLEAAYVTGLVKLRDLQAPVLAAGRVTATGFTQDRYSEAVAYFGAQDFEKTDGEASYYRYWLFGLPAGTFELTASASGFLKASSRVTVDPGQSLTLPDLELEKAVEVRVTVWSKDENGPIPWGNLWQLPYGTNDPYLPIYDEGPHRDILVRLINQYEESVGYWASDDIDTPYGPPWSVDTVDGNRNYPPLILKPSTVPSNSSYTVTLTDARGLPSVRLDGHVPGDTADFIEGVGVGDYTVEVYVTGYVMKESDDWERSFTVTSSTRRCSVEADLRRSSWIIASAVIPDDDAKPVSPSTLAVVAKTTDDVEKALAAGTFPAGADQFTMVLEGFNGLYNYRRKSTDYQDYGLQPIDYRLEAYMADVGTPHTGVTGVGWYITEDPEPELRTSFGTGSLPAVFHMRPTFLEVTLRSIRIQDPVAPSPWTFPGAGIRILMIDELGNVTATLDPTFYGLVQDDGTITNDPYDVDTAEIGWHSWLRVRYAGLDPGPLGCLSGIYPTRIEEGKYFVKVATLGYVQRDDVSTYITPDVSSDLQVDLIQGAQIRVELEFRSVDDPTAFNGFVRVEVYDQQDNLVGASIYAGAEPNPNLHYLPYDSARDWKLIPGAAEGAGTDLEPQRAFFSQLYYGIPPATWADWPAMTPCDANRLAVPSDGTVIFDIFGFHSYYGDPDSRREDFWANGWDTTNGVTHLDSGLRASRDALDLEGSGSFTIRVWAFDPYGPDGIFDSNGPDGIFGTEDDYTLPDTVSGTLSDFRAYTQVSEVTGVEATWGGTSQVSVKLEEVSSLVGVVSWLDMYATLRTLAWSQIVEVSPGSTWTSSTTGSYRLWLQEGSHQFLVTTVAEEQLWEQFYFEITLGGGGAHTFRDVTLTGSSTVTPEFPSVTWAAVVSLTAPLILLSKRRSREHRTRQRLT